MGSTLTDSLGPGLVLVIAVMWLAIIVATVTLPFVIFSIAGSLRGIHRELQRMNGTPVVSKGGLFPNATVRAPEPPPASLGHQLLR